MLLAAAKRPTLVLQPALRGFQIDTRLVMRPRRNTERVLNNAGVERLLAKERDLGSSIAFTDIMDEVVGIYPKVMKDGDMDAGAWSCGMVVGLIHDVPTVADLVGRIMREANAIIHERLGGYAAASEDQRMSAGS